jgi:hypothetical protein
LLEKPFFSKEVNIKAKGKNHRILKLPCWIQP